MQELIGNLNGVRVFEAAARLLSFKDAAEELHITPTAVSHQIRNLEQQLGVALFERRTRAVSLTDAGRVLADAARLSLQTLADAVEEISGEPKVLTVNTTSAFAALWLVPRLQGFYREFPDLRVVVQTDERLVDLQRDRKVDLAIRYGPPPSDAELLAPETFGLYGAPPVIEKLEKGRAVPVFETRWQNSGLPAVTLDHWWRQFMPRRKIPLQAHFDQEMHVIQAALAGQGAAFVSDLLVEMPVQQGWLLPYRANCRLPGFTYYLLERRQKPSEKVVKFKGWLKSELSGTPQSDVVPQ
ncbi:LysR family transcriptional regulator [Microbulbifer sp. CAU 1566]|uniref:LysR family transcriptional regulator n=1 Tax=Microbulbifer sp. CAU 1566 TaxID=2933269 RepID=UPI002005FC1C|nr:LysR family transcriptional regulator [Microbulbifer sp. CAU 1566]MCK7598666.1 LysR family transcriptional regulator [Microbulbifer sp. CAU 1566]